MSREAMKLALEALENAEYGDYDKKELNKAIIALREELAREQSTAWVTAGPHTVPLVTQPAKPDFWEGYVPEPMKPAQQGPVFSYTPDMDAVRRDEKEKADKFLAQLAQQALDKKAENARELGLDYEPAQPVVWHDAPQTIYLQVCPEADHCEVRFADHDEVTWCQDKIHDSDIAYVRASTTQQPPAQQEPVAFLANGTRFKISYDSRQSGGQIHGIPPELGGRWVAFVAADDDCHLKLTSPPAQRKPLTDEAIATVYWGATGQSLKPQDNVLAHNFARSIEAAHGIKENT